MKFLILAAGVVLRQLGVPQTVLGDGLSWVHEFVSLLSPVGEFWGLRERSVDRIHL